jgi:invasion protein IalB
MISRFLLIITVCAVYHVLPARADSELLGSFQSWNAYVSHNRGQHMCYISSRPVSAEGKNTKGAYAEVTHRPDEHQNGVIDILGGYAFKPDAPATLTIGKATFALFTKGTAAFAPDDAKVVDAMRRGDSMVFSGTDKKGNLSKASFTLKGMEQAYEAISKACNVEISGVPVVAHKAKKKT